jgi:hypothetical protein
MKQLILATSLIFVLTTTFSADNHDHEKKEDHKESEHIGEEKHDGEEHEAHKSHDGNEKGHAEHEEANPQVGPNKGITEASEENGIKLSPEAEKNFEIEKIAVNKDGKVSIHTNSIVTAGVEINVFRYRNGFYRRIDFIKISQTNYQITITSKDLTAGDFIVTQGLGFLRVAEIAAFGGAPEGHSH